MKKALQLEEARTDYLLSMLEEVRQAAKKDARFGFDGSINYVFKRLSLLSSQMYGPRAEKYLIERLGVIKVPSLEDRGDFKTKRGAYFENKISYPSITGTFNFLQFRPHQKLDGCLLTAIDKVNGYKPYFFLLSKEQAVYELDRLGGLCHLNKESALLNTNIEYRITLDPNTGNWNRWINNYSVEDFSCLKKQLNSIIPNNK